MFFNSLPAKVLCEVNGCEDYAVPEEEFKITKEQNAQLPAEYS